jgi:hypothetical protein
VTIYCQEEFCEFSLVDFTIWLTYFRFLVLVTLVHTHTTVQCLLFPCFLARVQNCVSTHSISRRYMYCSFVSSSTHFAYLSNNLCGITLFYPKYDGRTNLPGYKVPRSTSEQSPKSKLLEPRISYSACRVISSRVMQVKVPAWLIQQHGMKLHTTVDLWFYIFVIWKVNGVWVISYMFQHRYSSRIILRYSLYRKLCSPLRQCESFREKISCPYRELNKNFAAASPFVESL